jgi:glycosyltransferase involved in cell wall biosynthesis
MRLLLLSHAPVVHTQRWAAGLAGRGHEVRLLTAEPAPGAPFPGRVVVPRFPVSAVRYPGARDRVRREWREFRPDATVAHFLPNYGFLAALAGCRPLLLACWGSDLLVNASRTPFHRARARFTLERADLVHVDARMLGEAAVEHGAPRSRVWVRPWGVDTAALAPAEPWEARRARSPEARILWTRSLAPIYDPGTFLRALGLLRRRGVPFRATVAGAGPLRADLERLALDLEIAAAVRFTGFIGEEALRALYREHEIYVSLSRSDSTSQSLLEAMAAGLVPVVTDIEGNREWIVHRREGLLVPPGDPLAVACAVTEIARAPRGGPGEAMARAARAAVEDRARFEDTVAETEARLAALAERHGAGVAAAAAGSPAR